MMKAVFFVLALVAGTLVACDPPAKKDASEQTEAPSDSTATQPDSTEKE